MKFIGSVLILTVTFVLVTTTTDVQIGTRVARVFGSWFNNIMPRCTGCPPRHCVNDIAVIKGYCCGCARVSDLLPIDCPNNPGCPADGRKLCKDYDYMLDCCCNF